jgi:hypothetical protein
MSLRRKPPPDEPRPIRAAPTDSDLAATLRVMLALGAVATPIGRVSHVRMPGSQTVQEFPSAMVEQAQRDRLAAVERRIGLDNPTSD